MFSLYCVCGGVFFIKKTFLSFSLLYFIILSVFFSFLFDSRSYCSSVGVGWWRFGIYPVGWEVPCTKQIIVKYGILTRFQPVHATSKSIWRRFCDQSTYLIVYNNVLCTCVINVRYCDLYPIVLLLTLETFYVNRVWSFER